MIKKMIFAVVVMAFSLNAHSGELVKKKDSFAAAAPPNFAMAHAVEGQTCHRSGDIGMSLDGLILSCQSGSWKNFGSITRDRIILRSGGGGETAVASCLSDEIAIAGGGACGGAGRIKAHGKSGNGWSITCPRDNNRATVVCLKI